MQCVYKARINLSKSTLKTKPLIHPFTDKQTLAAFVYSA